MDEDQRLDLVQVTLIDAVHKAQEVLKGYGIDVQVDVEWRIVP